MKFYTTITEVALEENLFQKAKKFALAVYQTTNYSDSNQTQQQKIIDDHFISKLGEEAAKKVLSDYAIVTEPDYKIYTAKEKSWRQDLFIDETGISVKTMKRSAALRYELSWTFQCGEKRRDIILDKHDEWICFVEFDDISSKHFFVYPLFQIRELKFDRPKLVHLINHKLVVYAKSFPK